MTVGDPRLRFRVWVDGRVADETWVDASNPDAGALGDAAYRRHQAITDKAEAAGSVWMVEVYDPALPEYRAYTRFGTDPSGMVDPEAIT